LRASPRPRVSPSPRLSIFGIALPVFALPNIACKDNLRSTISQFRLGYTYAFR